MKQESMIQYTINLLQQLQDELSEIKRSSTHLYTILEAYELEKDIRNAKNTLYIINGVEKFIDAVNKKNEE